MKIPSTDSGFSLIEILIVVMIIAIAAAMAIPMMSSAGGIQVRSAANMVAADLEYAKSMAISRGRNFSVVFDKSEESYSVEDQDGVISHPVKKGFDYVVDFRSDGRLDKVDIADVDFNSEEAVEFDYLGSPVNGGGIITLQADGTTVTIIVEAVTGFISILP
jgi:type II secretion system protein H